MKILITKLIMPNIINKLQQYFDVIINKDDNILTKERMINYLHDCDGVFCQLFDKFDKEIIKKSNKLRIISNCAVGVNNIDITAASEKNILVTNTPGVLTNATADLAFALLLATARRIDESISYIKNGHFKGWDLQLLLGQELVGKTIGIIGTGRIGTALAKRTKGWDMRLLYYSNNSNLYMETELNAKRVDLDFLLKESDIISLHCPLTEKTFHLIGKNEFKKMKKNAILINTSRGEVIDEKELVFALKNNLIYGAGLDVFENEPQISKELLKLKNVICTPHIGSATNETRNIMAEMASDSLIDFLIKNKLPENIVNREKFSL